MFKNWIMICSVVVLTICLKTALSIHCYSCGSSIYECSEKNGIKKVKCGAQFSSCANIVNFYNNGTTIINSSFCYGQLRNDIERECREDVGRSGKRCTIVCNEDYCNSVNKFFKSPFGNNAYEGEYESVDKKSSITTPTQNLQLPNSSLECFLNYFLAIFSLIVSFMYCKF